MIREALQKSRDRQKFDHVVRKAIVGKSREEATEILIAEYRRQGDEPPGQPLLDLKLDVLLEGHSMADRVALGAEGIGALMRAGPRFADLFKEGSEPSAFPAGMGLSPDWKHTCRVLLDEDTQNWIGDAEVAGLFDFRDVSPIR